MNESWLAYERIQDSSWAYLSTFLILALFFKFNRFWAIRNLDLLLVILLAPGIIMVYRGSKLDALAQVRPAAESAIVSAAADDEPDAGLANGGAAGDQERAPAVDELAPAPVSSLNEGQRLQRWGYVWLFGIGSLLLARLLIDPALLRRPLLDPNLSVGGLVFLGVSLLAFTVTDIVTTKPQGDFVSGAVSAVKLLRREATGDQETLKLREFGPGYRMFHVFGLIPSFSRGRELMDASTEELENAAAMVIAAKTLIVMCQLAIVLGLVSIGYYLFRSLRSGLGMAVIYLMTPYTIFFSAEAMQLLPGALLVWAVALYRRPLVAGLFLGLAAGVSYYPFFLLPLWISFYWEKGARRCVAGVLIALVVSVASLLFTSPDAASFWIQIRGMFAVWLPVMDGLGGIWQLGWDANYRLPIMVGFLVLCISFAFWPLKKDLGTLIAYTAAVMVAVQFWHGWGLGGGLYMAWYLPLTLAILFRPALVDYLAINQVRDPITRRRRAATVSPTD